MSNRLRGVYAPVLTPFNPNLLPNTERFVAHCRWLVANNAGLAIFGTNSEAASLSVAERISLTDALLEAGIPADKLMPGTGACALTDAVTLTRHAVQSGAPGVLMVPPFFYKGASDDGLFGYYSEVIEQIGDEQLAVYLYHIPQMSYAPITLSLIERLIKRYPHTVVGLKDSSGDWNNTLAIIDAFAKDGFAVFPGSESFLSKALAKGGAGCISATANMNPASIYAVYQGWNGRQAETLQAKADAVRKIFQSAPMIPAMKRVVSEFSQVRDWLRRIPPLTALQDNVASDVLGQLRATGFDMPGYPSH